MTALLAAAAMGLLGLALYLSDGMLRPEALLLVLASLAVALVAACLSSSEKMEALAERALAPVLAGTVLLQIFGLLAKPPGYYLLREARPALGLFHAGLWAAQGVALTYLWRTMPAARLRFPLLLALYLLLGAWMIHWAPRPLIDAWYFQQRGTALLIEGKNPYASDYENIYGGGSTFYSPGTLQDNRVRSFAYTPLTLVLGLPGRLVGDVRWSLLLAVAGAAVFMIALLRERGFPAGHPVELAVAAFLFHPRAFFLIEQAWSEPYVALGAAGTVWALATERQTARWTLLALLLSAKQYAVLLVPSLWAAGRLRFRELALAGGGAALLALPFFASAPAPFWRGVVEMQIRQPFRKDALSVLAWIADATGTMLPSALGFLAAALVLGVALRRARGGLGAAVLGGAAVFLAFFVFNKQAFFNYYWFAGSLLALGLVGSAEPPRAPPESPRS